ncbi:MAG: flagellar biosynthesis repressor FlbT, partial [Albidovulum sp.]
PVWMASGASIVAAERLIETLEQADLDGLDPGDYRPRRLRDAIHPEEVNTPVRRVCYIAQLVLSGDADPQEARPQIIRGIEQLSQVFTDHDSRSQLTLATEAVLDAQFYQAMKSLRALLPREARLLAAAGT